MIKMKCYIGLITALLLAGSNTQAQDTVALNGKGKAGLIAGLPNLKVGDTLPDFVIPEIIRGGKAVVRTSDFKDRLLILDFWATGCPGCVEALPKMQALQKQFGDKIKILPVTYEAREFIAHFWKKNSLVRNLTLPTVVEDKHFSSYFRHLSIPHEVWIDKGKVIAITDGQYVDANNIKKVLNAEVVDWPVKYDFYTFNPSKQSLFPLDRHQVDTADNRLRYTAISGYKTGVTYASGSPGMVRDTLRKTVRVYGMNMPVYLIYLLNWNRLVNPAEQVRPVRLMTPNQVVWEVADKSKYAFDYNKDYHAGWIRDNGICFESLMPDTGQTDRQIIRSAIEDLDRLLGLKVRWEKRREKVFALVRTSQEDKLKGKALSRAEGMSLYALINTLNQEAGNPYVFDETGYKGDVSMALNIPSWTDIPAIRKALNAYGLDLKEEEREVDKFVFSEVNGGLLNKTTTNSNKN